MYGALDISTSGLIAQRTRLNIISANIANKDTLTNAAGEYDPYRRRFAILAPGDGAGASNGVHVQSVGLDPSSLTMKYEPGSPFADENGYVAYPNVNTVVELMNAMEASRSYEANIMAIEATKSMVNVALQVLA